MMKHDCWTRHLRESSADFRGRQLRQLQPLQPGQATVLLEGFFCGEYLGVHHYPMDLMGKMFFFFKWVLFMDIFIWRFINNGIFTVFNVGMMGIMVNINGECPIVDDDHACFQWNIDHFYSPSNGLNGREPVGTMFF